MASPSKFTDIVNLIRKEDPRYAPAAYAFLRAGLDHTVREIARQEPDRMKLSQHVCGPELLQGLRAYALDQFGPLTKTLLTEWGIHSCRDFGEMVFNLIEYEVFSKTDADQREDFADIYDFDEAFVRPFQPARRRAQPPSTSAAGTIEST